VRALVTGGAGFIGSHLVDRLLAEGHAVDVVDDLSNGSLANLASARANHPRQVSFLHLDVGSPELIELCGRSRPDVIYHLAAQPDGRSLEDPVGDARTGVLGTVRVLEAARACGAAKVVFASSAAAIYGRVAPGELPVRESHPQNPSTPAGAAKKAAQEYLGAYRERYGLEFTALALTGVYGPRQRPSDGVAAAFASVLARGEAGTIFGDGSQTRDLVFVDDAVDALARAAERGGGLLLNVGTGRETTIDDLHITLAGVAGVERPPRYAPARPDDLARFALDGRRAAIHLGWKPWTALVDGAAATLDAFAGHGVVSS